MWSKYQNIHPQVLQCLKTLKFNQPTDIQKEVLENYKYYYDFLLASQTGSGKTLAFGIPIISQLLTLKEKSIIGQKAQLSCLILTPTRELALQICQHLQAINPRKTIKITNIVGGLSKQKQQRLLSYCPDIVVATPGRFHELLSLENSLLNVKRLRFLVIDEADRMIELGHFRQVDSILQKVFHTGKETFDKELLDQQQQEQGGNPLLYFKDKTFDASILSNMETDKLIELPADFIKVFDANQPMIKKSKKEKKQEKEKRKDEQKQQILSSKQKKQVAKKQQQEQEGPAPKKRIFLVSATLTKEFKGGKYYTKKKDAELEKQLKKDKHRQQNEQIDSDLTPKLKALISRIQFTSKPKVIDLSSIVLIPQNLLSYVSYCEDDMDKMVHLVCYLDTIQPSANKKIIIFTNTIKASKLVSNTLSLLRHNSVVLHSNMQQRQRLSKLEKFTGSGCNTLICTDLAARGLDMIVDIVIQFGVPINGDTFVHRLGRTARAGRTGQGIIFIGKKEYSRWKDIQTVISQNNASQQHNYQFSVTSLNEAKIKVELAEKARINNKRVEAEESRKWLEKQAERADILLDSTKKHNQDAPRKLITKLKLPEKRDHRQEELSKWRSKKLVLDPSDFEAYLANFK